MIFFSAGSKQDLTSSPETKDNAKTDSNDKQNYVVKPRGRLRNPKPPSSPSNTTQQLGATASDVELSKMATTLDATGNYGDVSGLSDTGNYGKNTGNYGKHTQSSTLGGNFGTASMTLPAIGSTNDQR